jgi:hypothetical protein
MQHFTLTVAEAPVIAIANVVSFVVGSSPSNTFTIQTLGYSAAVLSLNMVLPANFKFVNNGHGTATLSGVPTLAQRGKTFTFVIAANNGNLTKSYQLSTLTVR